MSIALISAAALAYEILLMRLFSIVQWHHFAYMIISVALLGYGVSGTSLAFARRWWTGRFQAVFIGGAALFGVTALGCFLAAQALPFNALEILWDPRQWLWLLLIYLLLLMPFLAAAGCICLTFMAFPERIRAIYGADLLGAGLGAVGVIVLLSRVMPERALTGVSMLGLSAALAACLEFRTRVRWPLLLVLAVFAVPLLRPQLAVSPYKELSRAEQVVGAEVVDHRSSPLALLTTLASPEIPFRHAPGLSLRAPAPPAEQLALFTDGDAPSMIARFDGDFDDLGYLDYVSPALPYHLLEEPHVLVLGAGAGTEVLLALYHGASRVRAVELNPQVISLVEERFGHFSGKPYSDPRVSVHLGEARGFVAGSRQRFDLIQIALLDSFSTSAAGMHALSESYLYTVEAMRAYLDHLEPGGLLSITRWLRIPPRDGIRVFATAVRALEGMGAENPGTHLALVRSWNTTTLIASAQPLTTGQIDSLRRFSRERWFDVAWYPGLSPEEVNRYNQLDEPWLYQAAVRILGGEAKRFYEEYKFDVRPATDDRPHFFHFMKWRTVPEILSLRGQGGVPLLEQGYLVLVATFIQVCAVGLLLVALPMWLAGRGRKFDRTIPRRGGMGYFLAVGLGFMMIEIAFIQKFILFLSHPLYAVTIVLASFLVFAGIGSMVSGKCGASGLLRPAIGVIVGLSLAYLIALPPMFGALIHLPDGLRIVLSIALIAPLAFVMGMPFPLGLAVLEREHIPWAWAVNGAASVFAAVGATVLAVHVGFSRVVVLAALTYAVAPLIAPRPITRQSA